MIEVKYWEMQGFVKSYVPQLTRGSHWLGNLDS